MLCGFLGRTRLRGRVRRATAQPMMRVLTAIVASAATNDTVPNSLCNGGRYTPARANASDVTSARGRDAGPDGNSGALLNFFRAEFTAAAFNF